MEYHVFSGKSIINCFNLLKVIHISIFLLCHNHIHMHGTVGTYLLKNADHKVNIGSKLSLFVLRNQGGISHGAVVPGLFGVYTYDSKKWDFPSKIRFANLVSISYLFFFEKSTPHTPSEIASCFTMRTTWYQEILISLHPFYWCAIKFRYIGTAPRGSKN